MYRRLVSLGNLVVKPYSSSEAELKRSLTRTRDFLKTLGSPEKKLKFVHITGTSGKGSVSYYMHQILLADGKKVGSYTSPHTTTYLERFHVNDSLISPKNLTRYMRDLIKAYESYHAKTGSTLSFFELSTCLALYTFQEEKVEWCVLEVGCGGRYDATNIIPPPEVAIITNIDKDHAEILGSSLSQIAFEKAGIIKRGSIVICGEGRTNLRKIFMKEANDNSAALFFVGAPSKRLLSLDAGEHQQHNAALAMRAALEISIPEPTVREALEKEKLLPCRFELVEKRPTIFLDGAHSIAKIKALAGNIREQFSEAHILFGCAANKDAKLMLNELLPVAKTISLTRFTTEFRKAANLHELASYIPKNKLGSIHLDPYEAMEALKKRTDKKDVIVVTGSFFLTGELRALWYSEEKIVEQQTSWPNG